MSYKYVPCERIITVSRLICPFSVYLPGNGGSRLFKDVFISAANIQGSVLSGRSFHLLQPPPARVPCVEAHRLFTHSLTKQSKQASERTSSKHRQIII